MSTTPSAVSLLSQLVSSLNQCDELLREIRAENLDGSEPAVGEALENAYQVRSIVASLNLDAAPDGNSPVGQLIAAVQACIPYVHAAARGGNETAGVASTKAATAITAALIQRAKNAPAETAGEELAMAVRAALSDGVADQASAMRAALTHYDAGKDAPLTLGERCEALCEELSNLAAQGKGDEYCDEVQAGLRVIAEDYASNPENYE